MSDANTDRFVREYFMRLRTALSRVPRRERELLLEELQAHVAAARADAGDGSEVSVREILERLGDPDDIADEALQGHLPKATRWLLTSRGRLIAAGTVAMVMIVIAATFAFTWSSDEPGPSTVNPTTGGLVAPPGAKEPSFEEAGTTSLPPAGQQPADVAAAQAAVVNAFDTAYAPDSPAFAKAALVEGFSQQIVVAAAAVNRKYPSLTASAMPQVLEVVFTTQTDAAVLYDTNYQGHTVMGPKVGYAVLDGGTWKVTRATFCQDINNAGAGPTC